MSLDTRNRRMGPWNTLAPIIDSINDLENTNVKCTWFENIASGTSGTITPPTGATILLDQWAAGVDVLVSGIASGVPTFKNVLDTEGAIITGTLDAAGAWTISGTPDNGYPISLIFVYRVALSDFDQAYCLDTASLEGVNSLSLLGQLTYEITGFPFDESTAEGLSTIAFDNGTRTFSITPVGDKFTVWIQGVEYIYTEAQTVVMDPAEGIAFFYFDPDGVLSVQRYADSNLMIKWALCAMVYWDATNDQAIVFGDERHTVTMDGMTHAYLHFTKGAQYISGLQIADIDADGTGAADTDAEFSIGDGLCVDEDLEIRTSGSGQTLTLPAQIPVYYMDGATGIWRKDAADNFPVKTFAGGSNYLAFNEFSSPNWIQSEVSNTKYVLCHVFCTNDIDEPVIAIQGQDEYTSKSAASIGASVELTNLELTGFPVAEHVPLYTLIYQTGAAYGNTVKARIVTDGSGNEYSDWRFKDAVPSSGGGGGDVAGPAGGVVDNEMVVFDGASGKIIKGSGGITVSSGNITNTITAGELILIGTKTAGPALVDMIKADPDGHVELYDVGVKCLSTSGTGVQIWNVTNNEQFRIIGGTDVWSLRSYYHGAKVRITGEDTLGDNIVMLTCEPEGGVELLWAGAAKLLTTETGVTITGTLIADGMTLGDNEFIQFGAGPDGRMFSAGTSLQITSGDGVEVMAKFTQNGACQLRYNALIRFATTDTGADINGILTAEGAAITGILEIEKLPADDTGSGMGFTADVDTNTVGIGGILLLGADGSFDDADASAEATAGGMIVLATAAGTGNTLLLNKGTFQDAGTWGWTPGATLYLSETAGELTETAPTTSGAIVRIMGYALTADSIFFDPDKTYIEV